MQTQLILFLNRGRLKKKHFGFFNFEKASMLDFYLFKNWKNIENSSLLALAALKRFTFLEKKAQKR